MRKSRISNLIPIFTIYLLYMSGCGDESTENIFDTELINGDILIQHDVNLIDYLTDESNIDTRADDVVLDISTDVVDIGIEDATEDFIEDILGEGDVDLYDQSNIENTETKDVDSFDVDILPDGMEMDILTSDVDAQGSMQEARAVWVTRWDFEKSKTQGPASIATIMKNIADANFNMVYFQVRGRADAYYKSSYEPYASDFTGTLGGDPGWDPLAVAVEEAHKNGLEIHAWINTFTMWSGTTPPIESSPRHIYLSHPEWLVVDSNGGIMALNSSYVFATPGNPQVWDHIVNVVTDIALRYNIDGIHFDYIRYPGPEYSYDEVSNSRFQEAKKSRPSLTREDWQRDQVTQFLSLAYENLISVKTMLKITAAVWGIYKDRWNWGGTSEGYYDYYQDSQRWMSLKIVDAISPMIYWPMTVPMGGRTDYATLALDFVSNSYGRFVFAGMNVYPRSDTDPYDFSEMEKEINYLRSIDAQGMAIFSYAMIKKYNYFDNFKQGPFAIKAIVPYMNWK